MPLHSSLDNKSETQSQNKKKEYFLKSKATLTKYELYYYISGYFICFGGNGVTLEHIYAAKLTTPTFVGRQITKMKAKCLNGNYQTLKGNFKNLKGW